MFADTHSKNKLALQEESKFREALESRRDKILNEEIEKTQKERDRKKGIRILKKSGILEAYDCKPLFVTSVDLLDSLINHGLPKGDLLEFAAVSVQMFEKR